jgi:HD-like signal output (HDOD) protein
VKTTVLFVDDEPNILSGLKRMLRVMRQEMDFFFAESGREALAILARQHIDVIVSDMRMPGMDGASLLIAVQENYPHVTRIMLTGHADEEAILRTVGVVHQFLAKPADPEALKAVLSRACALQNFMKNDHLRSLVSSLGKLPSLPSVYAELQKKLQDPECAIGDVAAILEKDMAMSAKVLQLVNSAFFGLYKNIDSILRAVNLLGLDTVKALVLGVGVFSEFATAPSADFSVGALWDHSIATAAFAKQIAMMESDDKQLIDTVFIAGMMHDVGKLLLFSSLHDTYVQAVAMAREQDLPLWQAEQMTYNAHHGNVGSYLMGLWGLPGGVVESIAFHHRLDAYPEPSFSAAVAIHAADVIYYQLYPERSVGALPVLNQGYLEQAGLGEKFQQWVDTCSAMQV